MTQPPSAPPAADDARLVETWVARSASPHARRKYRAQAGRFLASLGRPLAAATLADLQAYLHTLQGKASATQANAAAALKSLFTFAQETGALQFNIGAALKAPPVKSTLAERILAEPDAMRMIALEPDRRNRALLTVLYGAGLRISEGVGLRWRDLTARDSAGQATVYGKGGKTRTVLLSANTWRIVHELRDAPEPDAFVFRSQPAGRGLSLSQAHRIVKRAAARAGLTAEVSAHWLRHAHASHALDRGAPIHLVQATLGHASVSTTGRYLHARPSESSARFLGV
ncbi:integrase/recombinase XerD [Methylorubrum rhodinum]|uniref:Integrase/recombinase XerD n=1 Tax=Methylorubrum rhodinum TaxID=29428 RepID=A0A840ZPM4_9HYPH|nr:tyrosine-type recombinase/integrase [Methylorubrum rhodinum]MBB5759290.1 integrase/recombinase XerD [Methylorubrum rhodinum]